MTGRTLAAALLTVLLAGCGDAAQEAAQADTNEHAEETSGGIEEVHLGSGSAGGCRRAPSGLLRGPLD
jgi:hypothetical protein